MQIRQMGHAMQRIEAECDSFSMSAALCWATLQGYNVIEFVG